MAIGDDPWGELDNRIGFHSETFKAARAGLGTGVDLGEKTPPGSYTVNTGENLKEVHTGGTVVIENIDYEVSGWSSRAWPATNLFFFNGCDKVVIDNVNIKLNDAGVNTYRCFEFRDCREVYIRDVQVLGAAWADIFIMIGCEYVLLWNSHIKGLDYGAGLRSARGINVYNGESGSATGGGFDLAFAVVQNNLVEDYLNTERTSYLGGIEVISPSNTLVFNNVVRNWIPHSDDPIPMQISHRRLPAHDAYGTGKRCRVARNIIDNPTPASACYVKLGSVYVAEQNPVPDNIILWENNIFNDFKWAQDQKAGQDVFVNNTFCATELTKPLVDIWNLRGEDAVTFRNNLISYAGSDPGAFIRRTVHRDSDDKFSKLDFDYNLWHSSADPNVYEDSENPAYNRLSLAAAQAEGMEVNGVVTASGNIFAQLVKATESFDYALHAESPAIGLGVDTYIDHADPALVVNRDWNGNALTTPPDLGAFQLSAPPSNSQTVDNGDAGYAETGAGWDDAVGAANDVIPLDAWSSGAATKTVGAGTDRVLIVAVCKEDAGVLPTVTGVTWGGQALTELYNDSVDGTDKNLLWVGYLGETGIAAGAGTAIVVSGTGTADAIHAGTYEFVNQTTPIADSCANKATGSGSADVACAGAIAVAADEVALQVHYGRNPTTVTAVTAGFIERTDEMPGGQNLGVADRAAGTSAAPIPTATFSAQTNTKFIFAAALKASAGGITGAFEGDARTHAAGSGSNTASWIFTLPATANFSVQTWYPVTSGAATDAPFAASGIIADTQDINQQITQGRWVTIFTSSVNAPAGELVITLTDDADGPVYADAVRATYTPTQAIQAASAQSVLGAEQATILLLSNTIECSSGETVLGAERAQVNTPKTSLPPAGHIKTRILDRRRYDSLLPDKREVKHFTDEDIDKAMEIWSKFVR